MNGEYRPELVFGVTGLLGTDLGAARRMLSRSLGTVKYVPLNIALDDALSEISSLETPARDDTEYGRIESGMDRANELRRRAGTGAGAALAVTQMLKLRKGITGSEKKPAAGCAYIVGAIKHPDEVRIMRDMFDRQFQLISVYAPRSMRFKALKDMLGVRAETLAHRDYHEGGVTGQSVRDTFPMANCFIAASDLADAQVHLDRHTGRLFGNPFLTPTAEESGMFHAYSSSLSSSSMSRQTGAVIIDEWGDPVSTGVNEVPKAGGGVYAEGDEKDQREFVRGHDSNQWEREEMLADLLSRLGRAGWHKEEYAGMDGKELAGMAMRSPHLSGMKLMDVTEYGREAHAEAGALAGAARRGASVRGCTMYCTTFPCHACAKHIVIAGIRRVVFIEPYPKSHAEKLFDDSISVGDRQAGRVHFDPYIGISPLHYVDFFAMGRRKDASGRRMRWVAAEAVPRLPGYRKSLMSEIVVADRLAEDLARGGHSANAAGSSSRSC